jgi:hypothetical protein
MKLIIACLSVPVALLATFAVAPNAKAAGGICDQFRLGLESNQVGYASMEQEDGSTRTWSEGSNCRSFNNGITVVQNTKDGFAGTFLDGELITFYSTVSGESSRIEFKYPEPIKGVENPNVQITLYITGQKTVVDKLPLDQVRELGALVTGNPNHPDLPAPPTTEPEAAPVD